MLQFGGLLFVTACNDRNQQHFSKTLNSTGHLKETQSKISWKSNLPFLLKTTTFHSKNKSVMPHQLFELVSAKTLFRKEVQFSLVSVPFHGWAIRAALFSVFLHCRNSLIQNFTSPYLSNNLSAWILQIFFKFTMICLFPFRCISPTASLLSFSTFVWLITIHPHPFKIRWR